MQGPFAFRVVGLPGDSIAVEKEICIINGKKDMYRLVRKNVPDEDLDNDLRKFTVEYEEFLPNGKNIHIYRLEITGEDLKNIFPYNYSPISGDNYELQYDDMDAIKIPENHYFLMGDFRSNANDSRKIGAIPREQIIGKVVEIKPPKKKQK
ncbi:MAG: signal peptidase I [Candidatus Azobacteroides sp.]|nr:signal peptidase I [Candidatus Azobacteroides sp.]